MSMTRTNYRMIARALVVVRPSPDDYKAWDQWQNTIGSIAAELERDNSRFNREMFYKACNAMK